MTLNIRMPEHRDLKPRISVFGVGGAGGNAVNNMIAQNLEGVDFVVANTDAQALAQARAEAKIQMGLKVTEGLGAGALPSVGAAAAEEAIELIIDQLVGAHMCFITAGMGGGTGTGAAPIIAQAARELGVLTVGVVTKPFQFEGAKRMRQAEEGVDALQQVVDTLIIIPNQNLFRLANERTTFTEAFALADDVLYQGVKGVTDLMVRPGLINLDFADVRAVMNEMGKAMMGTGEAEGEERAVKAAEKAIANPLLDEISLKGARGVLINITGAADLTLFEVDEAANRIREEVDPEANIIVGSTLDASMEGAIRVSVVATGIDVEEGAVQPPVRRRSMTQPLVVDGAHTRNAARSVTEPAPADEPEPAEAPEPEVVRPPAARAPAAPEPMLFADLEPDAGPPPADEDLPPPAYQPRAAAPMPAADPMADGPMQGDPAHEGVRPEVRARLMAAVNRMPDPAQATAPRAEARPEPRPQAERKLFGINSLINRMTGNGGDADTLQDVRGTDARHGAPQRGEERWDDPHEERADIPAFLRRQAN